MPHLTILFAYLQREAKSAKRKQKSYRVNGLTTAKVTIPLNIHTGLAASGAPPTTKTIKKLSSRVVVKTSIAKAASKVATKSK